MRLDVSGLQGCMCIPAYASIFSYQLIDPINGGAGQRGGPQFGMSCQFRTQFNYNLFHNSTSLNRV